MKNLLLLFLFIPIFAFSQDQDKIRSEISEELAYLKGLDPLKRKEPSWQKSSKTDEEEGHGGLMAFLDEEEDENTPLSPSQFIENYGGVKKKAFNPLDRFKLTTTSKGISTEEYNRMTEFLDKNKNYDFNAVGFEHNKGGFNRIIDGMVSGGSHYGFSGPLKKVGDPSISAGHHGPFFSVMKSAPSPSGFLSTEDTLMFLIPDSYLKRIYEYLEKSVVFGFISQEELILLKSKIVTFKEFEKLIKDNKEVNEETIMSFQKKKATSLPSQSFAARFAMKVLGKRPRSPLDVLNGPQEKCPKKEEKK